MTAILYYTLAFIIIFTNTIDTAPIDDYDIQLQVAKKNFVGRSVDDLQKLRQRLATYRKSAEIRLRQQYGGQTDAKPQIPIIGEKVLPAPSIFELNHALSDYLYQGDIVLTDEQLDYLLKTSNSRPKRQAYVDSNFPRTIWTNPVNYYFDGGLTEDKRSVIRESIKFWQDNTCITFAESSTASPRIQFINGTGCWSYIGRVYNSNSQQISIGDGCQYLGIITHEIGHALGFFHGQSRYDRDTYVTVNLNNVMAGQGHNFDKETTATNNNYGLEYDLGSVMHYANEDFAINTTVPVLIAKDEKYMRTMGNRVAPSFIDVQMMNIHYSCTKACDDQPPPGCQNGGYMDPKNCQQCICPWGFSGATCTDRQPASNGSASCGDTLTASSTMQTISARVGNDMQVLAPNFTICYWHINAPIVNRVEVTLNFVGRVCSKGCFYGGVEFKTKSDLRITGYRHCCGAEALNQVLTSDTNKMVVIAFSRYYWAEFQISYRYV